MSKTIEHIKDRIQFYKTSKTKYEKNSYERAVKVCEELIQINEQIKDELEVMELIKNGWSSTETTLNGEHIMRFQNLTLNDWLKLCNKFDEILLKKTLEVNNNEKL